LTDKELNRIMIHEATSDSYRLDGSFNAPEGRRLSGRQPIGAAIIEAHADLLTTMTFTPKPGETP
jgi:hypothetical protein